jgi:hypothetical protein
VVADAWVDVAMGWCQPPAIKAICLGRHCLVLFRLASLHMTATSPATNSNSLLSFYTNTYWDLVPSEDENEPRLDEALEYWHV